MTNKTFWKKNLMEWDGGEWLSGCTLSPTITEVENGYIWKGPVFDFHDYGRKCGSWNWGCFSGESRLDQFQRWTMKQFGEKG